MRTHTALHTLCGVVWRDHGALVTGGNMEPRQGPPGLRVRVAHRRPRRRASRHGQRRDRRRRARSACRFFPRDEAFAIPDLIRTKINLLPPGITEVRAIEIEGLDLQADGGTHVANTREVGRSGSPATSPRGASTSASGWSWSTRWTEPDQGRRRHSGGHKPTIAEQRQDIAQIADHEQRPG